MKEKTTTKKEINFKRKLNLDNAGEKYARLSTN